MAKPPPHELQAVATRLADVLADSGHTPHILQAMHTLGFFSAPEARDCTIDSEADDAEHGTIGIWKPVQRDGQTRYQRDTDELTGLLWASAREIPPTGTRQRVVLVGESVARGYFFDPHYNPATVLEQIVDAHMDRGVEVIDLARTDQSLEPLRELIRRAMALKPHALVVFAGNNWVISHRIWHEYRADFLQLLRNATSLQPLRQYIESRLCEQVAGFVRDIAAVATTNGIPVVLMIPEFNLADFATDGGSTGPMLADRNANAMWLRLLREARTAFAAGQFDAAAQAAQRLVGLDGGVNAVPLTLWARCRQARGDVDQAGRLFRAARDAELWKPHWTVPRCIEAIRATLIEQAGQFPELLRVVDVPTVFREWGHGALPGRELFLDYCHLSAVGTSVAMRAAAAALLSFWHQTSNDWHAVPDSSQPPEPAVLARAHLQAALHNSTWGQRRDIIAYHCHKAAEAQADTNLVQAICELLGQHIPPIMNRAFAAIAETGDWHFMSRLVTVHGRLHHEAVDALGDAFEPRIPHLRRDISRRRLADHSVLNRDIDLLDPFYCLHSLVNPDGEWRTRYAYFRAHTSTSRFVLLCDRPVPLILQLSVRIPGATSGELTVTVNGLRVHGLSADDSWRSHSIAVAKDHVQTGVNQITISWPPPSVPAQEVLSDIANALERGEEMFSFGIFGELARFTASVGITTK
ncbi:MAG: hypothetical protein MJE77_01815 [Proteobacteria bacterium]|nr:hypothetical protein [Pseudomonadota bacterium]